jgi:hypothetical protein
MNTTGHAKPHNRPSYVSRDPPRPKALQSPLVSSPHAVSFSGSRAPRRDLVSVRSHREHGEPGAT